MEKILLVIIVLLLAGAPALCLAQAKRVTVAVNHSGSDQVGKAVAYALKEAIRGSKSFLLFENDFKKPRVVVALVSVDTSSPANQGTVSAISTSILYDGPQMPVDGAFITGTVQSCASNRVEECARDALPLIDAAVERLRLRWPVLWKAL